VFVSILHIRVYFFSFYVIIYACVPNLDNCGHFSPVYEKIQSKNSSINVVCWYFGNGFVLNPMVQSVFPFSGQ
jgi:hypothetical protein